jgi:hypothetical protein
VLKNDSFSLEWGEQRLIGNNYLWIPQIFIFFKNTHKKKNKIGPYREKTKKKVFKDISANFYRTVYIFFSQYTPRSKVFFKVHFGGVQALVTLIFRAFSLFDP